MIKKFSTLAGVIGLASLTLSVHNAKAAEPTNKFLAEQPVTTPLCSCNGSVGKVTLSTTGATGWMVDDSPCEPGKSCPWHYYYFTAWQDQYIVPNGKCFVGTITWTLTSNETVPECPDSPSPVAEHRCPEKTVPFTLKRTVVGQLTNCD